jgi:hypothetical protein
MVHAKHLSLTAIGRAVHGSTARHGIKKVDRLLGNWRLHREVVVLYRCLARDLVNAKGRAVVLIDSTQIQGELWALTASVPFSRAFPREAVPVIVADGGFRSPFFEACFRKGLQYVIRLRPRSRDVPRYEECAVRGGSRPEIVASLESRPADGHAWDALGAVAARGPPQKERGRPLVRVPASSVSAPPSRASAALDSANQASAFFAGAFSAASAALMRMP